MTAAEVRPTLFTVQPEPLPPNPETELGVVPDCKMVPLPTTLMVPVKLLSLPAKVVRAPADPVAVVTWTFTGPSGEVMTPSQVVPSEFPPWNVTASSRVTFPTNAVVLELLNPVVPSVLVPVPRSATVMLFRIGVLALVAVVARRAVLLAPVLAPLRVTGPVPRAS